MLECKCVPDIVTLNICEVKANSSINEGTKAMTIFSFEHRNCYLDPKILECKSVQGIVILHICAK